MSGDWVGIAHFIHHGFHEGCWSSVGDHTAIWYVDDAHIVAYYSIPRGVYTVLQAQSDVLHCGRVQKELYGNALFHAG